MKKRKQKLDDLNMGGSDSTLLIGQPFPKDWLERFDEDILERLAIMTVDGGLSDDEALRVLGLES